MSCNAGNRITKTLIETTKQQVCYFTLWINSTVTTLSVLVCQRSQIRTNQLGNSDDENFEDDEDHRDPRQSSWTDQIRAGRTLGVQSVETIKSRIWPVFIYPLVKAMEVIDEVAQYSRRAELRRDQRFNQQFQQYAD
jgi:hypothetical protein